MKHTLINRNQYVFIWEPMQIKNILKPILETRKTVRMPTVHHLRTVAKSHLCLILSLYCIRLIIKHMF